MEVSTSILSVEKDDSIQTFYRIEMAHSDYFHIDVMDGKFVENNTIERMKEYSDNIKNISNIPLDVHLMVNNIKKYIDMFISCEPRIISFHIEAAKDEEKVKEIIKYIKQENCKVGIAINPETNIEEVYKYLPHIHNILIMGVHPGKGGQEFIESTYEKIEKIKQYITQQKLDTEIEVDGGINLENAEKIRNHGVDIAVAGNAVIKSKDYVYTIKRIKGE